MEVGVDFKPFCTWSKAWLLQEPVHLEMSREEVKYILTFDIIINIVNACFFVGIYLENIVDT